MNRFRHVACMTALLSALGLVVGATPAFTTDIRPAANPREEVVVVAPHIVHKKTLMGTNFRMPVYMITVTRTVSYADLDLSTPSGAMELQTRVDDAAKAACAELDRKYPALRYPLVGDATHCVEVASKDGQTRAQAVIAAYTQ